MSDGMYPSSRIGEYSGNIREHIGPTEGLSGSHIVLTPCVNMMRKAGYLRMMGSAVPAATQTLLGIYPVITVVHRHWPVMPILKIPPPRRNHRYRA